MATSEISDDVGETASVFQSNLPLEAKLEKAQKQLLDLSARNRLLSMPRAKELAVRKNPDMPLKEIREKLGGPGLSDEELLLRHIMKGDREIVAMRAAGRPKQYINSTLPLARLLEELQKHQGVRYVSLQRGGDKLVLKNQSAA